MLISYESWLVKHSIFEWNIFNYRMVSCATVEYNYFSHGPMLMIYIRVWCNIYSNSPNLWYECTKMASTKINHKSIYKYDWYLQFLGILVRHRPMDTQVIIRVNNVTLNFKSVLYYQVHLWRKSQLRFAVKLYL